MKTSIEKRKPDGVLDYVALAVTTFGVGYLPLAPGTWGSMVGVVIYLSAEWFNIYVGISILRLSQPTDSFLAWMAVFILISLLLFSFAGIWASGRATELLGNSDPPEAVVDEVMGQLITFLFIPFGVPWPFILTGFLLFRLFDVWKPYPIDSLQVLPGGIGVCADDILAGVYAGTCLSVIYALSLSI
jgi:phosphatidylglycerophosphatase A